MSQFLTYLLWAARLVAAIILLQTLYFKFGGEAESVYIFSTLGAEPWGRIGSGVVELIASILILYPRTSPIGAVLALGVMAGAILSHLFVLGITVPGFQGGDGGYLFFLALAVSVSSLLILWLTRANWLPVVFSLVGRTTVVFGLLTLLSVTAAFAQKSPVFVQDGKAIRGYDPVAYFTESKPVLGDPAITLQYEGATWQFASAKNRDLFKANPTQYAPQYGGYCAYGTASGYKAPTEADAWTIDNNKLYLNYNTSVRKAWDKDRPSYIKKADTNWPAVKGNK